MSRRVAVVGGGVGGLTAAYELASAGAEVVLVESTDRVGGKLRGGVVGGVQVDLGAESVLARRPEAIGLMDRIGLPYEPARPTSAAIWSHGALRPMPRTVMGVPGEVDALLETGVVSSVERVDVPVGAEDQSIGDFVAARLGREVVDRLVEPLFGGVYAGHTDRLSLRAAGPQIAALGSDLVAGAAAALARPAADGPVFVAPTGGVHRLPEALAATGGFQIRTDATVRVVERANGGWRLTLGPTTHLESLDVDGVVVATPAPATARLLAEVAPGAAYALAALDYASVAIVTFVLDDASWDDGLSGFLVPPVEGTTIKAATCSTAKWAWTRDAAAGRTVIRTSVGRAGETTLLHHDDATIIETALADLTAIVGDLGTVVDAHVQRWGGALPQYDVGHLDLVATVERDIATVPGLEVCGAAYHGVGIPAVIASAQAAARRLLDAGTMEDERT
ncbi:MAG TPA: protoporphyrinogen oxidase [Aeromicrobium sp.]|nr:protoporphyrinogen oxidase [Aeromicrobium sp.]